MKTYKTSFERINFGFDPPLKQTADVVFQTDIPYDDDHIKKFELVVWDAMWTQNSHWENPEGPIKKMMVWSRVLWNHEVTKLDIG